MATALALSSYWTDWLDLALRWLHVVAAIVWIGTSFYFVALDNHLRRPARAVDRDEGVGGEVWEIHGGGFYRVQKFTVAPQDLPDELEWFKWEAYTTWLSGFALLVTLYYLHPQLYLVDRTVAALSSGAAVAISIGLLVAAWLVYDVLCRLLGSRELLLAAALVAAVTATAYGVGHLFSGRGAYLEVGAMLGTIMAANVLFVIIPGHWALIRAKEAGRPPDPVDGIRGKQRSVHNNYLTLPVVFAMLSNHFAFAYGHAHAWAILVALMLIGAWIRHFFNLRHRGETRWAIPATAAVALVALAIVIRPGHAESPTVTVAGGASFTRVKQIVTARCVPCHSANPSNSSFTTAPMGIELDTAAEIHARASLIDEQAVRSHAMPLGNATGMTQHERDVLGTWIHDGAKIP
jgi:uncharacterized membrane protein